MFGFEEVDDGGVVCGDGGVKVVVEAVVVPRDGCDVVWLGGVGEGVVICECDSGLGEVLEVLV